MKHVSLVIGLALFLYPTSLFAKKPEADQILVKFKTNAPADAGNELAKRHGLTKKNVIHGVGIHVFKIGEEETADEVLQRVRAQEGRTIEFAEVDEILQITETYPNDPNLSSQWDRRKVEAPAGWDFAQGEGQVVAIIDTGVDCTHPDLSCTTGGYNFYANNTDTRDFHGHGTHMSGVAAAIGNNGAYVAGQAYKARIMPFVACDGGGSCTTSAILSGITRAVDNGVRSISISLGPSSGGCMSGSSIDSATKYAYDRNVLVFMAAGNNGTFYGTANSPTSICVGATDENDSRASFSNMGPYVDLSAPGVSILTTNNGGGLGYSTGTSPATPQVAGLSALLTSYNPANGATVIRSALFAGVDDLGIAGRDDEFGYGRINNRKAFLALNTMPGDATPPSAPSALTAIWSSTVQLSWQASTDNVLVTGYRIYRDSVQVGTSAGTSFSDTTTAPGATYSYVVKAIDGNGNLSLPSNTAVVSTPQQLRFTTNPSVGSKTSTGAKVSWTTNLPSTGIVRYGTSSGNLSLTASDGTTGNTHGVSLVGLSPFTTYYYRVEASATAGSETLSVTSSTSSFKTTKKQGRP